MDEVYEPTAEEIAEATRKIREGWSEREWISRIANPKLRPKEWVVPEVSAPDFVVEDYSEG